LPFPRPAVHLCHPNRRSDAWPIQSRHTDPVLRPHDSGRWGRTILVALTALLSLVAVCWNASASATSLSSRTPVLGQNGYDGPGVTGWGTYKPHEVFNGGDPSGHIGAIAWKRWGSRSATGNGKGAIFMPGGGYYPGTVNVALRAFDLGHCTPSGPLAYQRLDVRYPSRPGGKLGKWTPWSSSLCVGTSASATTSPTTGSSSACRDGQISVSNSENGGAGLGHEDQVILFTNSSQSACSLSGYPGVAGLDAQGNQAVQAVRTPSGYLGGLASGDVTPPVVVLAPGQSASATVEGTDNPVGTATSCPSYPELLVTPPDLTGSTRVAAGLPGCSPIQIHPVVPGTTGRTT
jgi:hypothetical protein